MPYRIEQHQANIILDYLNRRYPLVWFNVQFHEASERRLKVGGDLGEDPDRIIISFILPPEEKKSPRYWVNEIEGRVNRFRNVDDRRKKLVEMRHHWFSKSGRVALERVELKHDRGKLEWIESHPAPDKDGPWRKITFPVQEYRAINVDPMNVNMVLKRGIDGRKRKCKS